LGIRILNPADSSGYFWIKLIYKFSVKGKGRPKNNYIKSF
jgi:hypothetical protein